MSIAVRPGVQEEPFEGENRQGIFEAIGKIAAGQPAHVGPPDDFLQKQYTRVLKVIPCAQPQPGCQPHPQYSTVIPYVLVLPPISEFYHAIP